MWINTVGNFVKHWMAMCIALSFYEIWIWFFGERKGGKIDRKQQSFRMLIIAGCVFAVLIILGIVGTILKVEITF